MGGPNATTAAILPSDTSILNQPALTANGSALGLTVDISGDDYTIGGAGFELELGASGLSSTGAGNLTIQPNVELTANQTCNLSTSSSHIVRVTGNLVGNSSVTLTIANATNSNSSTLPNLRLSGNNSNFLGTIAPNGTNSYGLLLENPQAMIGGLIDLNNGNRNLWLTANNDSNPYVFGTAAQAAIRG